MARKPSVNITDVNLTWEQIQNSSPVVGIDEIAAYCGVDPSTVSEWIGSQVFPCWWEISTKNHCARSGDLDEWIANGFRPSPRKSFQKEISTDIIFTFKEYEVGKNCMAPTSHRIPLVWKPMIDDILKEFKQFDGKMSNFVRCAIFNLINDLTILLELNGHEASPQAKLIFVSSQIAEKHTLNSKVLSNLKSAFNLLKKNKNVEEIRSFLKIFEEEIRLLEAPWDKKAGRYLKMTQDLLKEAERRSRAEPHEHEDSEEEDIDEDFEDEGYPE